MNSNSKRIARNTLLLYFRMLLMLAVSLYTVRIVLVTLGAIDYGLFQVVGGIVTMFAFLSNTMASASQRFFSYEMGQNNFEQLKKTFSVTMTIYIILAATIFILAETVGLWFVSTKMAIPPDRMGAAKWVYQFSIMSLMTTMLTVPYNSSIIAHERMDVYAYVSILESVMKLAIVYLLVLFSYDKLKLYSILLFSVTLLTTMIYRNYCRRKFSECNYSFCWDNSLFKEILSYSGWSLFGSLASVFKNQGVNILLNIFFGPVVNAARGIAYQISGALNQFIFNFSTSVNPQIIKSYAANELTRMNVLVVKASKFSYFLFFVFAMPVLLETNYLLSIWLENVPEYTVLFTRLVVVNALIDSLVNPLMTSAMATGRIRAYQIVVGGISLLIFPLSYVFLAFGYPPEVTMYVGIFISIVNVFSRLVMLKRLIQFPIYEYLLKVLANVFVISILAYVLPYFVIEKFDESFFRFILICISAFASSSIFIFFIGMSKNDREMLMRVVFKKVLSRII